MNKRTATRVIEINVHRSKKNKRIGHAVAILFPCSHHKYLGLTLWKGADDLQQYRTQDCRVIKFEDYDIMDKEPCKLCPPEDYWLDNLTEDAELDDVADVLEALDE